MTPFFKMIGALLALWLGLFLVVMGYATTGFAVVTITLGLGLLLVIGAMWLTLYLLRRDAHANLRMPMILLAGIGSALVIYFAVTLLRAV